MGLYPTFRPPITEARGQYEPIRLNFSDSIFGGGWRLGVTIRYERRFPLPPEPSANQEWQVGFIQNVISVDCTCRYDSGRVVHINNRTPRLDAERPGTQAWIHRYALSRVAGQPVHPWAPVNYGGGSAALVGSPQTTSVDLSMQDYPHTQYFNFFRGGNRGDQLREVVDAIRFKVWLAARIATFAPQAANSYHVIAVTNEFELTYRLTIAGVNADFGYQARAAAMAGGPSSIITPPSVRCDISAINWTQASHSTPRPIVSGATANEALGSLQYQHGVGPLTRWGQ